MCVRGKIQLCELRPRKKNSCVSGAVGVGYPHTVIFKRARIKPMDFFTGMSYKQNQNQHKKLGQDSENRFSVQGLNSQ